MQRFNTFTMIHKALRAMLYDTALTLQQTYFPDAEEAASALAKVEHVLHQFESHAHHEDEYILPAIVGFEPQVVDAFEKEHAEDIHLGNQLDHLLNIFRATTVAEERELAGSAITKAFVEFMMFNLKHMAKEEVEINEVLWKYYTDEEIQQLNAAIASNIPQEEKALSAKWMMRGVNKVEAINWLKAMKKVVPAPVFWSVYALTRSELPVHRRVEIQEGVIEAEIAA